MQTEASPAERVRALSAVRGDASVAAGCAEILRSGSWEDRELIAVLGGRHADQEYERTEPAKSDQSYWAPTWAARGLLYAWADATAPAVVGALGHEYWRVREMAARSWRCGRSGRPVMRWRGWLTSSSPSGCA